jgi:hypothetical protein
VLFLAGKISAIFFVFGRLEGLHYIGQAAQRDFFLISLGTWHETPKNAVLKKKTSKSKTTAKREKNGDGLFYRVFELPLLLATKRPKTRLKSD